VGQYKVIFLGLAVAGPEEEARLLRGLEKKFGLSQERAERLLQRVPIVVKKECQRKKWKGICGPFRRLGKGPTGRGGTDPRIPRGRWDSGAGKRAGCEKNDHLFLSVPLSNPKRTNV